MPSTPLICSSMGAATVSAITLGLAPGYCARTTICGGATSGYSEIGITRSASRPARKISTDSTPAKIGRSMKKFERFMGGARLRRGWVLGLVCEANCVGSDDGAESRVTDDPEHQHQACSDGQSPSPRAGRGSGEGSLVRLVLRNLRGRVG